MANGISLLTAYYGVLRFVMESGADGCRLLIMSGKLREFRAKSIKYKDGYIISSSQAVNGYINSAVRHVILDRILPQFVYVVCAVTKAHYISLMEFLCPGPAMLF
ncbi:hypothetical protein MKX03_014156 [Papaver bracteatum]|nr:hypothetical protein MKX03_014156 [Papaver bracteatum]